MPKKKAQGTARAKSNDIVDTETETVKPKHPGGRPTKYSKDICEKARKLAELGATDKESASILGISEDTLYVWKLEHPEFSEALRLGKEGPDQRVKRSLYHRAIGYSHPDSHISNFQGAVTVTPITKHYPPDSTAGIFWLKNRLPDEFRERVEHTGKDGKDLIPEVDQKEFARRVAFALSVGLKEPATG